MSTGLSTEEQHIETATEFNELVFNEHDLSRIDEFLTEDVVMRDSEIEVHGIEEAREYFQTALDMYPDISLDTRSIVADDETVIFHIEMSGTNEGDIQLLEGETIPATGETATWDTMVSAQMEDGKMAEIDVVSDRIGVRKQLGLLE